MPSCVIRSCSFQCFIRYFVSEHGFFVRGGKKGHHVAVLYDY